MATALNFLSDKEQKSIEAAVHSAEKKTAAEIVCVVATESGRYDFAESLFGIITSVLFLGVSNIAWVFILDHNAGPGGWYTNFHFPCILQMVAVLVGFSLGFWLANRWTILRKPFVSVAEIDEETEKAASLVFMSRRLRSTRGAGGLLIYLSLYEHRAIVLADDGVMSKLGQQFLDDLRDTAIKKLKAGKRKESFTATIARATEKLAEALPIQQDDTNELPDALICIHPRP